MDIFFLLLFGHSLGDFAFQTGDFVQRKNPKKNPDSWVYYLTAHSIIHGGFVGFFTGSLLLSILETVCHWLIDFGKMEGKYTVHADQTLHVACKVVWIVMLAKGIA